MRWKADGDAAPLRGAGLQPALQLRRRRRRRPRVPALPAADASCRCEVERRFLFVAGEDAAAALDAESEDDVLALEPGARPAELVEDELLLALPLVPRHEVCPEPLPLEPRARGAGRGASRSPRWRR